MKASRSDITFSIYVNQTTEGKHRLKITLSGEAFSYITMGLHNPRFHIHGNVGNGFKIFCMETGGLKPRFSGKHAIVTLACRSVGAREQKVDTHAVEAIREYDDSGPVIRIERVPDAFLPDNVLKSLPRSKVDPETAMAHAFESANKRLRRETAEIAKISASNRGPTEDPWPSNEQTWDFPSPEDDSPEKSPVASEHVAGRSSNPIPASTELGAGEPENAASDNAEHSDSAETENVHESHVEHPERPHYHIERINLGTPSGDRKGTSPAHTLELVPTQVIDAHDQSSLDDLKAAVAMVNDIVGQLGEGIRLYVDEDGKLHAKRRVITYMDL